VQSAQGLAFSRFVNCHTVLTLHGPASSGANEPDRYIPDAHYVGINDAQSKRVKSSVMGQFDLSFFLSVPNNVCNLSRFA
jgi:hypothetical protein